ncbi:conjugal transfer protein [Stygiolobus caldivivus]|uniref:conjugal transfer protein n=1 Tax=Stygiolobus caldivivus TaxID=2824673 RepID=UPI001CED70DE|nr:conjugal transfer protein [Stygiolobus caldivivus]
MSKAYLSAYGGLITYPALLVAKARKGSQDTSRYEQKVINSLETLVKQSLDEKKIKENLRHDPVGKSQIPALLRATAKFLKQLGEREIAKLYEQVADYLEQGNRTYMQLLEIRKRILSVIQLKKAHEQLLDIIEKCLQSGSEDEICKNLPSDAEKIFGVYKEKPYLVDQILTMLDLGIQEMFDAMVYTAYLAKAASIADYSAGRDENDEKYLEEVRDHQKEIIEFIMKYAQINKEFVKSDELDEFMREIEDNARHHFSRES